jgi:hypothetical protein
VKRLVAVLVAVGMVVAAVVIRDAIDDESGGGGGSDGELVVICASDMLPACDGLEGVEVIYQAAATTARFIAEGSPQVDGVDGWVTTSAWLEVVEARAPGVLPDAGALLATSPAVVAVEPARRAAVQALCEGTDLWRCLGDHAGEPWAELGSGGQPGWGPLRTGLPDANTSSGLPVIASVAAGFFGSTDYARNDFELEDFGTWLGRLAEPSGDGHPDPIHILATVQGQYTAVGDRAASVYERDVEVLQPEPSVEISAVVVPLGGDDLPGLAPLRAGLEEWGWIPADGALPGPTLKPGVMAALHTLWMEVTG